jgi:hypothetical protein
MTLADAFMVALAGLMDDPNFGMTGTILQRTPTLDKYGNKLDTAHETIEVKGFFTEGMGVRAMKEIDARGVEPRVAGTMFYTKDLTTPISLKDKFLYNQAYYNIMNIMLYKVGSQVFMRRLILQTSEIEENLGT